MGFLLSSRIKKYTQSSLISEERYEHRNRYSLMHWMLPSGANDVWHQNDAGVAIIMVGMVILVVWQLLRGTWFV